MGNTGNKNNILCYNETFKWRAKNTNPNTKKGLVIMENKNTQANKSSSLERNELHNTIWKVANELRGSVDGWDFKQYVLGILFYRYISENMAHYINKQEREHDLSFDYALLSDE